MRPKKRVRFKSPVEEPEPEGPLFQPPTQANIGGSDSALPPELHQHMWNPRSEEELNRLRNQLAANFPPQQNRQQGSTSVLENPSVLLSRLDAGLGRSLLPPRPAPAVPPPIQIQMPPVAPLGTATAATPENGTSTEFRPTAVAFRTEREALDAEWAEIARVREELSGIAAELKRLAMELHREQALAEAEAEAVGSGSGSYQPQPQPRPRPWQEVQTLLPEGQGGDKGKGKEVDSGIGGPPDWGYYYQ